MHGGLNDSGCSINIACWQVGQVKLGVKGEVMLYIYILPMYTPESNQYG